MPIGGIGKRSDPHGPLQHQLPKGFKRLLAPLIRGGSWILATFLSDPQRARVAVRRNPEVFLERIGNLLAAFECLARTVSVRFRVSSMVVLCCLSINAGK